MTKRILALLHVMLIVLSVSICAFADTEQTGSLGVGIEYEGEPVAGGSFMLHKVASIVDGTFRLDQKFLGSGVKLEDVQSPSVAQALADYAEKSGYIGVEKQIDADGSVVFPDLETGLYLVAQEEAPSGYYPVCPFLISIPNVVDGKYDYSVDASPKVDLKPSEPEETTAPTETTQPDETTAPTEPTKPDQPSTPQLPQTGQLHWPVGVLVISGMILMMLGWYMCRSGKAEDYEA